MKNTTFCKVVVLFVVFSVTGCDPFSDDELPPATALINEPYQNSSLTVGVANKFSATIRTAVNVDSLVVELRPEGVANSQIYQELIPTPISLSSISDNPTEIVIDEEIILSGIEDIGVSNYMISLQIYLADGRWSGSGNVKSVQLIFPK